MLISFEGADCSGKSTQALEVSKSLTEKNFTCLTLNTPSLEKQLSFINTPVINTTKDDVKLFLHFARETTIEVDHILPNLSKFDFIITDRSIDSLRVYNKLLMKFEKPDAFYKQLINFYYEHYTKPDLTFIITCTEEQLKERLALRSKKMPYEKIEFMLQIQEEFIKLAKDKTRAFVVVDTTQTIQFTTNYIVDEILKRRT